MELARVSHRPGKQPKLAALQASIGSANASVLAQEKAPLIVQSTGDHKYRKQQASTGVLAAQAEYDQAIHDVTQAVAWTYYSVVYASEQVKVAKDAVDFVDYYRDQVQRIINEKEGGNREFNQITLNKLSCPSCRRATVARQGADGSRARQSRFA